MDQIIALEAEEEEDAEVLFEIAPKTIFFEAILEEEMSLPIFLLPSPSPLFSSIPVTDLKGKMNKERERE